MLLVFCLKRTCYCLSFIKLLLILYLLLWHIWAIKKKKKGWALGFCSHSLPHNCLVWNEKCLFWSNTRHRKCPNNKKISQQFIFSLLPILSSITIKTKQYWNLLYVFLAISHVPPTPPHCPVMVLGQLAAEGASPLHSVSSRTQR